MRKNFKTIKDNVAKDVYDTSSNMLAILGNYANIKYFDILRRVNYNALNYDYSFTTTAGTKDYALPQDFSKAVGALYANGSQNLAELGSIEELYRNEPSSLSLQGTPSHYVIFESTVMVQPSATSLISIVSSSASDTTQTIYIKGISSGVEVGESITLTGTATATSTNSYTRVKSVGKDGDTYGVITLTCDSKTIAILSPKARTARYSVMRLWKTPNDTITINIPYMIKPSELIDDNDYPIIDIEDIIEMGTKALAHSYQRREATANKYEAVYEAMITNYIWEKENKPNSVPLFQPNPYSRDTI